MDLLWSQLKNAINAIEYAVKAVLKKEHLAYALHARVGLSNHSIVL